MYIVISFFQGLHFLQLLTLIKIFVAAVVLWSEASTSLFIIPCSIFDSENEGKTKQAQIQFLFLGGESKGNREFE